nr:hypothetical protein [uncultured Rhodopila sp.]
MHRDVQAAEDLPTGLIEMNRSQQWAADERLEAVVAALNAVHDHHGLLSDDFPSL